MPSSSICKGQSIRIDTGTSRFRKIIEIDFVRLALSFLVGIGNREGENFRIKLNSHLVHSRHRPSRYLPLFGQADNPFVLQSILCVQKDFHREATDQVYTYKPFIFLLYCVALLRTSDPEQNSSARNLFLSSICKMNRKWTSQSPERPKWTESVC